MSVENKVYQIVVVDDHPLFRQAISVLITQQSDLRVCGEASEQGDALALVIKLRPDLVLVDLNLGNSSGLELIKAIKAQSLRLKMLVISGLDERLYARRCLQAGASGYISKTEPYPRVLEAIRKILNGEVYVSEEFGTALLSRALVGRPSNDRYDQLSDREFEVLNLYGKGLSTAAIATQLNLNHKTIASHRATLMRKLGLAKIAELVQYALRCAEENS